jgi:hypothetical protein
MNYKEISKKELAKILEEHAEWLMGSDKGKRADLSSADLSYADLSSANLSYADLRYANLSKRYIQISCIGSRKGMTTYCFDEDVIFCGCFKGNLAEFENQVKITHKDNKQFLAEYLGFIEYIKNLKK